MLLDWTLIMSGITGGFLAGLGAVLAQKLFSFVYKKIKEHAVKVTKYADGHSALRLLEL